MCVWFFAGGANPLEWVSRIGWDWYHEKKEQTSHKHWINFLLNVLPKHKC